MTANSQPYKTVSGINAQLEFEKLYSRYAPALLGILVKIVNDTAIAEDLLQDVFVKVWKNSNKYNETKGTIFTWLLNITRNTGIDYLRSRNHKQNGKTVAIENGNGTLAADNNENAFNAKQLVNSLDKKHREVLDLLFIKGHSQQEAAIILNIPLGTVKTRARNAVLILRKQNTL